MLFRVNVRRILREDANVYVQAEDEKEAAEKAKLEGSANPEIYDWQTYDAEYWIDEKIDIERA